MGLFGSNKSSPLDIVTKVSVFPTIGSIVLRKDNKLLVFSPQYLLGKHGDTSREVASKFMNLSLAKQLLELIDNYVSSSKLSGERVEIKEMNFGSPVGTDALVKISPEQAGMLHQENVRGNMINTIFVDKGKIPTTNLLNMILVPFNPQYGGGVEQLFKQKYGGIIGFEHFEGAYAVLTIFPGKYAPPMSDASFWNQHALLKEMN